MPDPSSDHALLLRCMVAAAGADGALTDAELSALVDAYRDVTGNEVGEDTVRETLDAVWRGGSDGLAYVVGEGKGADLETRIRIATACYRVLAADGEITGPEAGTFNGILAGLELSRKAVLERL